MVLKPNQVSAMTALSKLEDLTANNKRSLTRLHRAINFSQGQFSALLVCCDDIGLQEKIANQLRSQSSVKIQTLVLQPSVNTLYTAIKKNLGSQQPQALMVFGLESVVALDQVLVSTNLIRDEFRKQFRFPLVLWVNKEVMQKLIRLAPDFKNWAANAILFEVANKQFTEWQAITV